MSAVGKNENTGMNRQGICLKEKKFVSVRYMTNQEAEALKRPVSFT